MISDPQVDPEVRKRAVRRTTLFLTAVALAFYGGFIVLSVLRAH